jgi:hypothetical protein
LKIVRVPSSTRVAPTWLHRRMVGDGANMKPMPASSMQRR